MSGSKGGWIESKVASVHSRGLPRILGLTDQTRPSEPNQIAGNFRAELPDRQQ
jgi:hypothetical protein